MRSALAVAAQRRAGRVRSSSLSAVPPAQTSADYDPRLASIAASILYRSPEVSESGRPVFVLNAAAFPDAFDVDYDSLLAYVLARLPDEDDLLAGTEYEIVFFAGGPNENVTSDKKQGPGMGWYLQAYHVLSRALRKKLQRLYIVHPRTWVRVLIGIFGTVVSPKFRRKIITCNTLSMLALQIPIEKLLIPPSTYLHDRKLSPDIDVPYANSARAFGVRHPLPKQLETGKTRLPRVLREASSFLLLDPNINTEGIFRVPAHTITVSVLKEAYDRGQKYIVWKENGATFAHGLDQSTLKDINLEDAYGVFVAASIIKSWYRDLREPLFPSNTYPRLRSSFGDTNAPITADDLVTMLDPNGDGSFLTTITRQIMTRHLLPLCARVASHSDRNKMTAENLSICFCMNLICGPNQMEDMQISKIVRRILQSAIESWPQIRQALDIGQTSFQDDLEAPSDDREYEDPVDEVQPQGTSVADASSARHKIVMADVVEQQVSEDLIQAAPALPPRPVPLSRVPLPGLDVNTATKRKPAPPPPSTASDPSTVVTLPHRQASAGFESTGTLPSTQSSAIGISSKDVDNNKTSPAFLEELSTLMNVPKRKAVRKESLGEESPTKLASNEIHETRTHLDSTTDHTGSNVVPSPAFEARTLTTSSDVDETFRRPLVPASVVRKPPNIQSLAKPVIPTPATFGASNISPSPTSYTNTTSTSLSTGIPRHRTPSPGLLARMPSSEHVDRPDSAIARKSLQPGKLTVRKSSVDDLRRLYEERTLTAQGLARAQSERRGSSSSVLAGV